MNDVDRRRVQRAAVVACALVLAVVSASLFVADARKNAEIDNLRQHGVTVVVSVTGCLGLLGGSGSNAAGNTCRGSFTLDGRRHVVDIPGDVERPPGTTVRAVTVASDPGLLETVSQLSTEHASVKVFVLPSVLALVLVLAMVVRLRSTSREPRRRGRG